MWTRTFIAVVALFASGLAQADLPRPVPPDKLVGEMARLSYFLGDWEIDATWNSGQKLRARNEFRIGLAGQFMELTTIVQDGDGPVYPRYKTIYQHGEDGYIGHGFVFNGTAKAAPAQVDFEPQLRMRTEMEEGGTIIRNDVIRIDDNSYAWKVWMKGSADAEWTPLMDGVWKRMQASVQPIDTGRFAAGGTDVRQFTRTATIAAPAEKVFAAWATAAGWGSVFGSPSTAHIDLAIGGRYEWLFDGQIGSNGCQVLSYIPDRMISFSWNAPPTQAESRAQRTWVVVEMRPTDDGETEVTLTHLGFGSGPKWDETRAYFEAAWERVLSRMSEKLAEGSHGAREQGSD